MPIYAFACTACGHAFDRLQRLADADPTDCPECGKPQLKRQLTAPQFRLAGGGWYETDFKKDGDRKRNLVEGSEGAGKSDAKPDGKSDSKSAEAKKPAAASKSTDKAPTPKSESKPAGKPASGEA